VGHFFALNLPSGHICATTLWAFDFAITLWALRNLNFRTIIKGKGVIYQFNITLGTGRVDCHAANITRICRHNFSPPKRKIDENTQNHHQENNGFICI
jgi:hypothetical protein